MPLRAPNKKMTPNTMNTRDAPVLTYRADMYLEMILPKTAPRAVSKVNASITPKNTCNGALYSADRAITASCVLSPSSITAISRKDVVTVFECSVILTIVSSFENSV